MDELFEKLDSIGAITKDAIDSFMYDKESYLHYVKGFPQEGTMNKIVDAMNNKNYTEARKAVHALKGIVKNLRFEPLADATEDMLAELDDNNIDEALKEYENVKKQYKIFCDVIETYGN